MINPKFQSVDLHIIMGKKPHSHDAVLYVLFIFFFFKIFTMDMAMATPQKTKIPIRVGLVLDMDNYIGEMGLKCIKMALSDFYATHSYYETRLVLYDRDSKGEIVGAAAAALDLLKNVEVQAIMGPLYSVQANFMIDLGGKAQVPIITFSATSPSLSSIRSPYFFRSTLDDSSQVKAICAVIQAFGWREVVPIYVDNEFGQGIVPYLTDALEQVNAHVPYRSVIPSIATDDQIVAELYKLMSMQTRVFVVHMQQDLASRLFTKAKQLGMMSEDYAWIITDGVAYELDSVDPSVFESMQGVIGVKPYVPKSKELDNFNIRYKKRVHQNNTTVQTNPDLNIFGLWAYDSAIALALAAEKAGLRNDAFRKANVSRNFTDLEAFGVSRAGPKLIQALSRTEFRGLTGKFPFVEGQLQSPPYQIVNVVGPLARVVGYWTKENGIVRDLKHRNVNTKTYSTSKSSLGSIIWPGDKAFPPKGWVIPTNEKRLRIGVPVKGGFTEFLHVTWNPDNSTEVEGYCIDVFDAVMAALPYGVPYEYIPFSNSDHEIVGTYNDLVYQVYLGNIDAAVGDVTITANRSQDVDFTLPYTESGVSMVVPIKDCKRDNAWVFLKPLTWDLWLTSFCSFVVIGFLIWILEHRINEEFRGPPLHQVGLIFWFAFSTMVFAHKEKVISNLARFVLILWFLVVFILTQSYTASLTSMLTVQQLQPAITDVNELIRNNEYVGYQEGSFVFGLLKKMNFDESRLLAYNSTDELDELLSKGSRNGGISAAFDEIPYMKLFLAKYCSKYSMVDPTYKADGFAFVFPKGSPLVPDVSRAILNVTESKRMMKIEKAWLGDNKKCSSSNALLSSQNLGLESFWGLFLIVSIAAVSALIIYTIKFLYENWNVIGCSNPEATVWSKMAELFRRFDSRDLTSHTFKNATKLSVRENGCNGDYKDKEKDSSTDNCLQSSIFLSPSEHNMDFPGKQASSSDDESRHTSSGEASHEIKLEIS